MPQRSENPKVTDRGEMCCTGIYYNIEQDRKSFKAFYSFTQQLDLERATLSKIDKLRISIVFSDSFYISAPALFALSCMLL